MPTRSYATTANSHTIRLRLDELYVMSRSSARRIATERFVGVDKRRLRVAHLLLRDPRGERVDEARAKHQLLSINVRYVLLAVLVACGQPAAASGGGG